MSAHEHPRPIGGKIFDGPMMLLLALFALAVAVIGYRVVAGVGPVSNMTDGFTWGIWEPVNVVVFTGVGAGAYGVGLLCYLLNREHYHAFVRPSVLVGAIAYSLGGSSILVALGRYWNSYLLGWVPFWNLSSALLEVAICVMTYVTVLWIEVLPAILDKAAVSDSPSRAAFGKAWGQRLQRSMPYIIALAILLPTMHQSSLGGLMLIAISKVHPLWHTALLPTLFLISCLSMGYGSVVVLMTILHYVWGAKFDLKAFAQMSKVNAGLLLFYVALRFWDLSINGKLRLGADFATGLYFFEQVLFLLPAWLFFQKRTQQNKGRLFGAALLSIAAGAFYRVDTYLTAYNPGKGFDYFPSYGELTVTIGMAAIGIAVFVIIARLFPVVVVEGRPNSSERTQSNLSPAILTSHLSQGSPR
jgi:Ni/Fe-hydrogenase subunit HybB-like protein